MRRQPSQRRIRRLGEMVVTEEILSELEKRGKEEKTKPELLEFYRKLLEIQYEAEGYLYSALKS